MSRPFPYPAIKKEQAQFNDFIGQVLSGAVDLQRALRNFEFVAAPTSSTDNGREGMMAIDDDYIYVCTSLNTWKRVAISTW